jgi:hypothetical protein
MATEEPQPPVVEHPIVIIPPIGETGVELPPDGEPYVEPMPEDERVPPPPVDDAQIEHHEDWVTVMQAHQEDLKLKHNQGKI